VAETEDPEAKRKTLIARLVIALVIIIAIVLAIIFRVEVLQALNDFIDWMKANPVQGAFLYIGIYAIATITFMPGSVLTLGAGFAFKFALVDAWKAILVGTAVVMTGASLGASCSFFLGRFVFKEWVTKKS
jgi:uncharacterized membrane protein YdjX (TVP38/TMEM64 family)